MPSGKRAVGSTQAFIVARIREEMMASTKIRKEETPARDMTQAELARRAGVPETTLSKILHGDSALDVEQAGAIAGVFGLELWELAVPAVALPRVRRHLRRIGRRGRQPGRSETRAAS